MSNRDIIVIGGSAGATAPLKQILGRLPADLPAAVFVVLHIPAQGIGILSTVASSAGPLPVRPPKTARESSPARSIWVLRTIISSSRRTASSSAGARARTWCGRRSMRSSARPRSITGRASSACS
ncbi:hypothetical protein ABH994_004219 [Bradyrhizobium yuanmingense]